MPESGEIIYDNLILFVCTGCAQNCEYEYDSKPNGCKLGLDNIQANWKEKYEEENE